MITKPRSFLLAAAFVVSLALAAGRSWAAVVTLDQYNSSGGFFSGSQQTLGDGVGQSFVPTLNAIDAARFIVYTAGPASTVRVDVFDGPGYTGTLLGSSPNYVLTQASAAPLEIDFAAPVALTPGNTYTLRLTLVAGAGYHIEYGQNSPYPDGILYDINSTPFQSLDLVFKEGGSVAVPAPSTLAAAPLLAGVLFAASKLRRGRRAIA